MERFSPEVLISEEDIILRTKELGQAITRDYQGGELVVVCVLKGAFIFCANLVRQINLPVRVEFISLSSYKGTQSSGEVKLEMDISGSLQGKDVLLVEDIVDTGLTLKTLVEIISLRMPKSLKLASLLHKPARTKELAIPIDYLAFEVEDKFVIGHGLDYAGRYRELPYIGILNAGN